MQVQRGRGSKKPDDRDAVHRALRRVAGDGLDVVDLTDAPPLLRFEIARDGILLAEAEARAWADFKAHAMIDWWDWAPIARLMIARRPTACACRRNMVRRDVAARKIARAAAWLDVSRRC